MTRAAALAGLLCIAAAGWLATPVAAQLPQLKRALPVPVPGGCAPVTLTDPGLVTEADRREAARLASSATQSSIVGDHAGARDLLTRAARLDPESANIVYLLARAHEELRQGDRALQQYCRYLAMAPDAPDAEDVLSRVATLAPPGERLISEAAELQFRRGLSEFDLGRMAEAEQAFTQVVREAPEWPDAYYNRAVVYAALGQEDMAAGNFERYLELVPDAADGVPVARWVQSLRSPAPRYNAGAAAFTSVLVPGLGHLTTGRPMKGLALLSVAAGAVAFGVLSEDISISCLSVPANNVCPAADIAGQTSERPYLAPALGAAGVLMVYAAIDAYRGAAGRNREAGTLFALNDRASQSSLGLGLPVPISTPGRVALTLLEWRF